jgi:hypothetical protein
MKEDGVKPDVPLETTLNLKHHDECRQSLVDLFDDEKYPYDEKSMICAFRRYTDSCQVIKVFIFKNKYFKLYFFL